MKRLLLLALPAILSAQNYFDIIKSIDKSPALKSALHLKEAASFTFEAARGKRLPTIDAYLSAAWLKDTPTVTFRIPGAPETEAPMGTKRNFVGSLKLTYPIFTGYAISAVIDKAELEQKKAELALLDLKRNLYLEATKLAGECYTLKMRIEAEREAKKAMQKAYEKAKGLYEQGLIPPADLYNIEAKLYAVEAQISDSKSQKDQLLNSLSYLTGKRVDSVDLSTDAFTIDLDRESLIKEALKNREDIKSLESLLKISKSEELLAKSSLYPTVAITAELKRRGDTLSLNGDGFTNADQSYIGALAKWNIFSGFADSNMVEAARRKTLAASSALSDYKRRVKIELENSFLKLNSIFSRLQSAKMELKARSAYCDLTKGRFENQLASADELSRSIADLAEAKAKVFILEGSLFTVKATIFLMAGIESFKKGFAAKR